MSIFGIMKIIKLLFVSICFIGLTQCNTETEIKESVIFYKVPLECGAAPEIGCGSRIKPLFIDTEKEDAIKESWTNRQGTIIAIKWKANSEPEENGKLIQSLFKKHNIEAELVTKEKEKNKLLLSLEKKSGQWLEGMEVDKLSIEEAGVIAESHTNFAFKAKLLSQDEYDKIRNDIEEYFKKELVKVRTYDELISEKTQSTWMEKAFAIYVKHVGAERAELISKYYVEHEMEIIEEESCCSKDSTEGCSLKEAAAKETSEITCPKCGHKKTEVMPTEVCQIKYTCEKCKTVLYPKEGDCCVFCTYGTHKCPSMQN
jgi:hypothetical protein